MLRMSALVVFAVACAAPHSPTAPPAHTTEAPAQKPSEAEVAMAALRADVEMICGAIRITGGTDVVSVGPYIAEHMKTDLLADLFANLRTTTTLDMIVERIRKAMAITHVERCATLEVLIAHDPRKDHGD